MISVQAFKRYLAFTLLLFVFACGDDGNPTQNETPELVPVPAEPVDINTPEALFTDAATVADGNQSEIIIDRLIELIDAIPEDGSVYVSIYLFEYEPLFEALGRAHTRNVSLHVMMDMSDRSNNSGIANRLTMLEENVEVVRIYNNASGSAINHNKFVLLPEVTTNDGSVENVVFQTSQNFTESGTHKIQDGVILSDAELYNAYLNYWKDMKALANEQMNEFEYREYVDPSSGITAYFYPKRKNGTAYGEDTIIEVLDGIDNPSSATVRIAMSAWTDSRMVIPDKLEELLAQGTAIEVVTKNSIGSETISKLQGLADNGADITIYNMTDSGQQKVNIHSKFMMLEGVWNGQETKLLLTGTQNFTMNALRNNNEATLQFQDHAFYNLYVNYFEELKTLPAICCSAN